MMEDLDKAEVVGTNKAIISTILSYEKVLLSFMGSTKSITTMQGLLGIRIAASEDNSKRQVIAVPSQPWTTPQAAEVCDVAAFYKLADVAALIDNLAPRRSEFAPPVPLRKPLPKSVGDIVNKLWDFGALIRGFKNGIQKQNAPVPDESLAPPSVQLFKALHRLDTRKLFMKTEHNFLLVAAHVAYMKDFMQSSSSNPTESSTTSTIRGSDTSETPPSVASQNATPPDEEVPDIGFEHVQQQLDSTGTLTPEETAWLQTLHKAQGKLSLRFPLQLALFLSPLLLLLTSTLDRKPFDRNHLITLCLAFGTDRPQCIIDIEMSIWRVVFDIVNNPSKYREALEQLERTLPDPSTLPPEALDWFRERMKLFEAEQPPPLEPDSDVSQGVPPSLRSLDEPEQSRVVPNPTSPISPAPPSERADPPALDKQQEIGPSKDGEPQAQEADKGDQAAGAEQEDQAAIQPLMPAGQADQEIGEKPDSDINMAAPQGGADEGDGLSEEEEERDEEMAGPQGEADEEDELSQSEDEDKEMAGPQGEADGGDELSQSEDEDEEMAGPQGETDEEDGLSQSEDEDEEMTGSQSSDGTDDEESQGGEDGDEESQGDEDGDEESQGDEDGDEDQNGSDDEEDGGSQRDKDAHGDTLRRSSRPKKPVLPSSIASSPAKKPRRRNKKPVVQPPKVPQPHPAKTPAKPQVPEPHPAKPPAKSQVQEPQPAKPPAKSQVPEPQPAKPPAKSQPVPPRPPKGKPQPTIPPKAPVIPKSSLPPPRPSKAPQFAAFSRPKDFVQPNFNPKPVKKFAGEPLLAYTPDGQPVSFTPVMNSTKDLQWLEAFHRAVVASYVNGRPLHAQLTPEQLHPGQQDLVEPPSASQEGGNGTEEPFSEPRSNQQDSTDSSSARKEGGSGSQTVEKVVVDERSCLAHYTFESFRKASTQELQRVFRTKHIMVTGCPYQPLGFDEEGVASLEKRMNSVISAHDHSIPVEGDDFSVQEIKCTFRQFIDELGKPDGHILNGLNFPLSLAGARVTRLATCVEAFAASKGRPCCRDEVPYPSSDFNWALGTGRGSHHHQHMDAAGANTLFEGNCGCKFLILARGQVPKNPEQGPDYLPFASNAAFGNQFAVNEPITPTWAYEGVLIRPGDMLFMRANTVHFVYTPEDAIFRGCHFYTTSTLRETLYGLTHVLMGDIFLTNTAHPKAVPFLLRMVHFFHEEFVVGEPNFDRLPSHLPDVREFDGFMDLIHLCSIAVLFNVLDPRTYQLEHEVDRFSNQRYLEYDSNAVPTEDRWTFAFARGLVRQILDWLDANFVLKYGEGRGRGDATGPPSCLEFFAEEVLHHGLFIINYRREVEEEDEIRRAEEAMEAGEEFDEDEYVHPDQFQELPKMTCTSVMQQVSWAVTSVPGNTQARWEEATGRIGEVKYMVAPQEGRGYIPVRRDQPETYEVAPLYQVDEIYKLGLTAGDRLFFEGLETGFPITPDPIAERVYGVNKRMRFSSPESSSAKRRCT